MKVVRVFIVIVVLAAVLFGGYQYGHHQGFSRGYEKGYSKAPKPDYYAEDNYYSTVDKYNQLVDDYNNLRKEAQNYISANQYQPRQPINCTSRLSYSGTMTYTNCY